MDQYRSAGVGILAPSLSKTLRLRDIENGGEKSQAKEHECDTEGGGQSGLVGPRGRSDSCKDFGPAGIPIGCCLLRFVT